MRRTYPHKTAVVFERHQAATPPMRKYKFIVPADLTCSQLMYIARKQTVIAPSQALFFFVSGGTLAVGSDTVGQLAHRHVDPDGFLYITYTTENAFGTAPA